MIWKAASRKGAFALRPCHSDLGEVSLPPLSPSDWLRLPYDLVIPIARDTWTADWR